MIWNFLDNLLVSYSPSFVASSCLLAIRNHYNLEPVWPEQLKEITTYSESDLKICSSRILGYVYLEIIFFESGYLSLFSLTGIKKNPNNEKENSSSPQIKVMEPKKNEIHLITQWQKFLFSFCSHYLLFSMCNFSTIYFLFKPYMYFGGKNLFCFLFARNKIFQYFCFHCII